MCRFLLYYLTFDLVRAVLYPLLGLMISNIFGLIRKRGPLADEQAIICMSTIIAIIHYVVFADRGQSRSLRGVAFVLAVWPSFVFAVVCLAGDDAPAFYHHVAVFQGLQMFLHRYLAFEGGEGEALQHSEAQNVLLAEFYSF